MKRKYPKQKYVPLKTCPPRPLQVVNDGGGHFRVHTEAGWEPLEYEGPATNTRDLLKSARNTVRRVDRCEVKRGVPLIIGVPAPSRMSAYSRSRSRKR
jgi:hypothetical protein